MDDNQDEKQPNKGNWFYRFDSLIKTFIPKFNVRAILYISVLFATVMYLQIWRISDNKPFKNPGTKQETVIADESYWQSKEYKDKIQTQTVESFTSELENWLNNKDQEFVRRKFEDMLFINSGLSSLTGGDLTVVVPENFNYLENHARARYQYSKEKGFLNDKPTLVKIGSLVCELNNKTEKATSIELLDFRYASMPKLAEFMKTKPDWKVQIGDKILDVSDPRIEHKDILRFRNSQTQPAGLFSFLVFREPQNNRIFLADTTILENNGVDAALTLSRLSSRLDKQPKLYFKYGYEGCKQINDVPQINYGHSD
jgi:hypothetical protein